MIPDVAPVPREGCVDVESKLLLRADDLSLALLRFGAPATIDEHAAPHEIVVACLEGAGFTSVAGASPLTQRSDPWDRLPLPKQKPLSFGSRW